jgi:hypothetical protein
MGGGALTAVAGGGRSGVAAGGSGEATDAEGGAGCGAERVQAGGSGAGASLWPPSRTAAIVATMTRVAAAPKPATIFPRIRVDGPA